MNHAETINGDDDDDDDDDDNKLVVQQGIIFRRTIRASYATLDIVVNVQPPSKSINANNNFNESNDSNHEGIGGESDLLGVRNQGEPPATAHPLHLDQQEQEMETKTKKETKKETKKDQDQQQDTTQQQHVTILLQFDQNDTSVTNTSSSSLVSSSTSSITACRSHIRRICKIGTLIEVCGGKWLLPQPSSLSLSNARRLEVRYSIDTTPLPLPSSSNTNASTSSYRSLKIIQIQKWDMVRCQKALAKYYPLRHATAATNTKNQQQQQQHHHHRRQQKQQQSNWNQEDGDPTTTTTTTSTNGSSTSTSMNERKKKKHQGQTGHGGGVGKRQQGEIVSEFLIQLIMTMLTKERQLLHSPSQRKLQDHERIVASESKEYSSTDTDQVPSLLSSSPSLVSSAASLPEHTQQDGELEMQRLRIQAIQYLNNGTGVLDVAGGSGHVSLALGLKGIQSTVVDPRENVGRLPGRDRKHLRKVLLRNDVESSAKSQQLRQRQPRPLPNSTVDGTNASSISVGGSDRNGSGHMAVGDVGKEDKGTMRRPTAVPSPPPIEFSSLRAWFAKRPEGVDVGFREGCSSTNTTTKSSNTSGDDNTAVASTHHSNVMATMQEGHDSSCATAAVMMVPVCSMCSPDMLLPSCSAILALHPDEATGDIVGLAVQYRIPFLIVPCCVFSRLFPDRFKPLRLLSTKDGSSGGGNDLGVVDRQVVSTYDDLIEYLVDKDDSIQVTKLDFDGANMGLWSTFPGQRQIR